MHAYIRFTRNLHPIVAMVAFNRCHQRIVLINTPRPERVIDCTIDAQASKQTTEGEIRAKKWTTNNLNILNSTAEMWMIHIHSFYI
jgi:hypothetical protein